ncbi:hypothetical protein Tco_1366657 [Tanacetum coccineum]
MRSEVVVAVEWRLPWMVVMMVAHEDDGCGCRGGSGGSGWCVATAMVEMKRGDPDEITEETPATDVAELGQRMTDFVTTVRQDTYEIYGRLDDAQDDRLVMNGQLNLLRRDRRSHARTARLMEGEARVAREAWAQSMDTSDTACYEVRALRTRVLAYQTDIGDLRAADRK